MREVTIARVPPAFSSRGGTPQGGGVVSLVTLPATRCAPPNGFGGGLVKCCTG